MTTSKVVLKNLPEAATSQEKKSISLTYRLQWHSTMVKGIYFYYLWYVKTQVSTQLLTVRENYNHKSGMHSDYENTEWCISGGTRNVK